MARNSIPEWLVSDGSRYLGDLKCSHCAKVTRHALLRPGDGWRHWAEYVQGVETGQCAQRANDYTCPVKRREYWEQCLAAGHKQLRELEERYRRQNDPMVVPPADEVIDLDDLT